MRSIAPQPYRTLPDISDSRLCGAWLNHRVSGGKDFIASAHDGTATAITWGLHGSGIFDGTSSRLNIGNIAASPVCVCFWIKPASVTQEILRLAAGATINLASGTITYTGITASATYVNGAASTTLAASQWQHVACVFTALAASAVDLAYDGSGYGQVELRDVRLWTTAPSAAEIARMFRAGVPDSSLVLWVPGDGRDYSRYARSVTITSQPKTGEYITTDGTDDKLDYGDLGNIRTISFWARPSTTTQELLLIDTGKDIMVSSGTITYTGLTPTATYVNGTASTTLAASVWQHVVCVLNADVDANNFEIGNDGANYGAFDMRDLRVFNEVKSADWAALAYRTARGGV
uniref:Putative lectin/glucanase superfamily protein n=2 Tax=viral metagenome TaxID=1070528 RepID=A0A6M3KHB3_9ZZZZ